MTAGYFLLLQPGHGHWSQPQPVHASRIIRDSLAAGSVEVRAARTVTTNPQNLGIMPCKGGCRSSTDTPAVRPSSWFTRARDYQTVLCFASWVNAISEMLREKWRDTSS